MKITECACGRTPRIKENESCIGTVYRVTCLGGGLDCWIGPLRRTKKKAVKGWNVIMDVFGKENSEKGK